MRLDKLRGYGPWFAFATPILFVFSTVYLILVETLGNSDVTGPPAPWFFPAIAFWLLLMGLFILSGLVVAIDLEWIEHPRTNTPMTYVGLGGMVVSTLAFLLFLLEGVVTINGEFVFVITIFLVAAGLGVYLVVMNLVGMRAGLLGRWLPVLGIVSGALFLVSALLILVGLGGGMELAGIPALALYLVWSLWLGFRLRGKAPVQTSAPAPT
jgi:hypothetical protein